MCVGVAGRSPLPQTYCEVKNGWIGAGDARAGVGYSSFDGGLGWEGLVPVGAVTMVTGEPGIGNSLVAMHVAAKTKHHCRSDTCNGLAPAAQNRCVFVIILASLFYRRL